MPDISCLSPLQPPQEKPQWIGRFAPSPTGNLHFGSLVAAVASFMVAKSQKGQWLVRIEDLDPPREVQGSAESILISLEAFGLYWDADVIYQSHRKNLYQQRLEELIERGIVYRCDCSRKLIDQRCHGVYDGHCRVNLEKVKMAATQSLAQQGDYSLRVIFPNGFETFSDSILGECIYDRSKDQQDFIVKRRDQLFAYQLAVVTDDIEQGVNHVVRGQDILDSTPRQNYLYQCFERAPPVYYHIPLALDLDGKKLSKQFGSAKLEKHQASELLLKAIHHLGQTIDGQMQHSPADEIIEYYIMNWQNKHYSNGKWLPVG